MPGARALMVLPLTVLLACSRPVQTARTTITEAPSERELEAEVAVRTARCSPNWSYLLPGLGQLCLGERGKGGLLIGLTGAEVAGIVALGQQSDQGYEHAGVGLLAVGIQDLWVYGVADTYLTRHLATRQVYTPTDSVTDLLAAPFNAEVMKRPAVWIGILGTLAIGVGASLALSEGVDTDEVGDDPNVLGKELPGYLGYPAGFAVGTGLFSHVAIAEEALFRGLLQSSLARSMGETPGWLVGSLIFGLAHAPNALVLEDPDERRAYLMYGLPIITVVGSYLGYLYKDSDYSLAPPVALHFWYDFLLTSTFFVLDPKNSPISASLRFSF